MDLNYLPIILSLLYCSSMVYGGRILVFPMDGSHWLNLNILIKELHSRGHEITVVRPEDSWLIQENSSFYKTIKTKPIGNSEKIMLENAAKMVKIGLENLSFWKSFTIYRQLSNYFYEKHKTVVEVVGEMFENKQLMHELKEANYDLVLTDPATGGGFLMAARLGLPLVLEAMFTLAGDGHSLIAPSPLSYIPVLDSGLTPKMTFMQRVRNIYEYFLIRLKLYFMMEINYKPFVHHYFGPDIHYSELLQAADIWLLRTDFTLEFPRPTMPNVVYIAGFQCKPAKPLSIDMEDFVRSSGEHGVVLMSFGTLVSQLPEQVIEEFAAALAKIPQKVIWRYTGKKPSSLGNNTLLVDWLPQGDLLGHPKTKVFITHGGMNSILEAVYHGVPLIGFGLMFDQHSNLFRMEVRGVAKVLDIASMNRDTFLKALKEVLYEPIYTEKMKALSRVHRDTPLKPTDTAVYWIEYVMRHKGAKHLRSESYKLSFIQYYCIDVIVVLITAASLLIVILVIMMKLLWRCIVSKGKVKKQ